jgi:aspartyl/asparaginyl-tRNA synthetase
VSAGDLYSEYKANEVAADAQYKGKTVQVTGIVDSIGKDILDTAYVTLTEGGEYEMWGVQCMFAEKYESELAQLSKGQTVTIQGKVEGYLINVLLHESILIH